MDKCWYCIIDGATKGPFTLFELKRRPFFTLETLVWRPGFAGWVPAKEVKEIVEEEEEELPPELSEEESVEPEGETIAMEENAPPNYTNWLILLLLVLIFYLYRLLTS